MDQAPILVGLLLFTIFISVLFFYFWLKARRLRDALKGQDGHRLMVVFTNLFLWNGIAVAIGAARQVVLLTTGDSTLFIRSIMSFVGSAIIVGSFIWTYLYIRSLINSRNGNGHGGPPAY